MKKSKGRKTQIICTLGPASSSQRIIQAMSNAGMNVARLNFSHGSHKEHKKIIDTLRLLNKRTKRQVRILQDLEGYRIRVGHLSKPVMLKRGQRVLMVKQEHAAKKYISFDYQGDIRNIKKGRCVFIDDGNIILNVVGHSAKCLKLKVAFGGLLRSRKGINIPGLKFRSDILTKKDKDDIEFGIENHVDFVAQSFVRNSKDILRVVDLVKSRLPKCKIIAKIENEEGIKNLNSIMSSCDGIMIARGDLGVSVPIYKIAAIQKDIIKRCNRRKKFVITATQMLENMVEHNRPTRAEVTDVANAILDGTNYAMLSAETASGRFPVLSVKMMSQIIEFTEKS